VKLAHDAKIPTLECFFDSGIAREINKKFDVINASGVFFHLEELHSVCEGIKLCLKHDGVFIVQFIYMKNMQENMAFDQIYHEHLLYYTLETLETLLKLHGLEIFDAQESAIHGGSMIAFISHPGLFSKTPELDLLQANESSANTNSLESYEIFARGAENLRFKTKAWFENKSASKEIVYGLGAPVKGNTLINYFGLNRQNLPFLIERNTLRRGLFSPGAHIPILLENEIPRTPDSYFVLAWNFKQEILERHKLDVLAGVEFYFPIEINP
jgi:hypothetical protein